MTNLSGYFGGEDVDDGRLRCKCFCRFYISSRRKSLVEGEENELARRSKVASSLAVVQNDDGTDDAVVVEPSRRRQKIELENEGPPGKRRCLESCGSSKR